MSKFEFKFDSFMIIALAVIIIDQFSKYSINAAVKNTGAAFGLLQGHGRILIFCAFIAILVILYYKEQAKGHGLIGLSLLFGGIIGNLIDRIVFNYVRDFIKLPVLPAFNIADIANLLGVLLLIYYLVKKKN